MPTKEESNSHTKVVNNFAGAVGIFSLGVFVADTFLHLDNPSGRIFLNVFTVYKNVLLARLMYMIVLQSLFTLVVLLRAGFIFNLMILYI